MLKEQTGKFKLTQKHFQFLNFYAQITYLNKTSKSELV